MPVIDVLEKTIRKQQSGYFGKYRAFVVDTDDPEKLGRIRMTVPSVLGEAISDWALPSVPYGGGQEYGMLYVPPADSQVLAEFIEGDISSPVWVGTFWREPGDMPAEYQGQTTKILKTESGHVLTFEDEGGDETVLLRSANEAELLMDPDGSLSLTDSNGAKVVLDARSNEILIEDSNGNSIVLSSSGITCTDAVGNEIRTSAGGVDVKASAVVNIEGAQVTIAGGGGEPLVKGASFLGMFNAHTHVTAVGPTGPPVPPLTPSVLTTKSTAQ